MSGVASRHADANAAGRHKDRSRARKHFCPRCHGTRIMKAPRAAYKGAIVVQPPLHCEDCHHLFAAPAHWLMCLATIVAGTALIAAAVVLVAIAKPLPFAGGNVTEGVIRIIESLVVIWLSVRLMLLGTATWRYSRAYWRAGAAQANGPESS